MLVNETNKLVFQISYILQEIMNLLPISHLVSILALHIRHSVKHLFFLLFFDSYCLIVYTIAQVQKGITFEDFENPRLNALIRDISSYTQAS